MTRSPNRRPELPRTSSLRVIPAADLRRLHRLLLVVCAMEVVDLSLSLWKLWR